MLLAQWRADLQPLALLLGDGLGLSALLPGLGLSEADERSRVDGQAIAAALLSGRWADELVQATGR